MNTAPSTRVLGRSERLVPAVFWDIAGPCPADAAQCAIAAGANWFIPREEAEAPADIDQMRIIVALDAKLLVPRNTRALEERLESLNLSRCEALLIESPPPGDVKSGRLFHCAARWREAGLMHEVMVEADDHASAEWLLEQTPAHAVGVPLGLGDLTARYRLLQSAAELSTTILARPPIRAWDAAFTEAEDAEFLAGESGVIQLRPLTGDVQKILDAVMNPMPEAQRQRWWDRFRAAVPEPPRPKRSGPPEFA